MIFDPYLTPFDLESLRGVYDAAAASPVDVIEAAFERVAAQRRSNVWISLVPRAEAVDAARRIADRGRDGQPLFGLPFAVKDNIDVAGLPTTAACPDYAYMPTHSAVCVERLQTAGAICIGKTNLDQFATGLSGVRSPYGACGSAFDKTMIAGGSSSGSAVAVALHQVAFALGTDTGGSGRVPAAFNNVVGVKPTIGVISTRGLVPNCRTLDCVSVFGLKVVDCLAVAEVMRIRSRGGRRPLTPSRIRLRPPTSASAYRRQRTCHFSGTPKRARASSALLCASTRLGAAWGQSISSRFSSPGAPPGAGPRRLRAWRRRQAARGAPPA